LLLDEPASGLVEWSSMELALLVRRLATEWRMGILVIEHDIRFVATACDSVMALDFGEAIAFGSPEVVRHHPAVVAAYLGEVEEVRRTHRTAPAAGTVGSGAPPADLAGARPDGTG
jgi:sulfate-transporting ATPase